GVFQLFPRCLRLGFVLAGGGIRFFLGVELKRVTLRRGRLFWLALPFVSLRPFFFGKLLHLTLGGPGQAFRQGVDERAFADKRRRPRFPPLVGPRDEELVVEEWRFSVPRIHCCLPRVCARAQRRRSRGV